MSKPVVRTTVAQRILLPLNSNAACSIIPAIHAMRSQQITNQKFGSKKNLTQRLSYAVFVKMN